jgi:hypothetical protein
LKFIPAAAYIYVLVATKMKYFLLTFYLGLLLLLFVGLPDTILYDHGIIGWTPFILIFFVQTFLLYQLLKSFDVRSNYLLGICALSVLIIGPSFGYYSGYQEEKDLQKRGKKAKGIVYKKWYKSGKNSEWLLRCHYLVDGETYSTSSKTDSDNEYKVGDTLTIIYDNDFPQKSKIVELE